MEPRMPRQQLFVDETLVAVIERAFIMFVSGVSCQVNVERILVRQFLVAKAADPLGACIHMLHDMFIVRALGDVNEADPTPE